MDTSNNLLHGRKPHCLCFLLPVSPWARLSSFHTGSEQQCNFRAEPVTKGRDKILGYFTGVTDRNVHCLYSEDDDHVKNQNTNVSGQRQMKADCRMCRQWVQSRTGPTTNPSPENGSSQRPLLYFIKLQGKVMHCRAFCKFSVSSFYQTCCRSSRTFSQFSYKV